MAVYLHGKRLIVTDACKTSPRHLPIRYKSVRSGAVTLRGATLDLLQDFEKN